MHREKPRTDPEAGEGPELLSLPRALAMAGGLSDSTRRRIPDFPRPVVLSRTHTGKPCRIAFVRSEVCDWVASRIAAARSGARETAAE